MLSISNTSSNLAFLQFKNGSASYSRVIKPGSTLPIKEYEEQYLDLQNLAPGLTVKKYNIVINTSYIDVVNSNNFAVFLKFDKSPTQSFSRKLFRQTKCTLSPEEYSMLNKNLPSGVYIDVVDSKPLVGAKKEVITPEPIDVTVDEEIVEESAQETQEIPTLSISESRKILAQQNAKSKNPWGEADKPIFVSGDLSKGKGVLADLTEEELEALTSPDN